MKHLDGDGFAGDAEASPMNRPERQAAPLVIRSGDFVRDFSPPDYLLDGILQKRFLYSCTAMTGAGKTAFLMRLAFHVATGTPFAGRHVERGRVVYFAGENPDDVRMRWIVMADKLGFDINNIDVSFVPGALNLCDVRNRLGMECKRIGGVALAVIDTSAAYFQGSDENDNVQAGRHARDLRDILTTLPGNPCVLVACHPTKNASNDQLLPRGGGAYVAEVDGNLTARKDGDVVTVHWQGKFRGPEFAPIGLQLETVTSERLKDSRKRRIPTVMASPLSRQDLAKMADVSRRREDMLLLHLAGDNSANSIAEMARALNWLSESGEPQKSVVHRVLTALKRGKLVVLERGRWMLTEKGEQEAEKLKAQNR